MILRRIRLSRVACFRESIETGPMSDGLNILAANNEEGKSTLVRAAARVVRQVLGKITGNQEPAAGRNRFGAGSRGGVFHR